MGVLLTGRRARRFAQLVDGQRPGTRKRDREWLDVVEALRSYEPTAPRAEFRESLRAHLLAASVEPDALASDSGYLNDSVSRDKGLSLDKRIALDDSARAGTPDGTARRDVSPPARTASDQRKAASVRGTAPDPGKPDPGKKAPDDRTRSWRSSLGARPALIGALAASVVVSGITVGTRRALPGEPFYGLKRQVENIQLDLTSSRVERAKIRLEIARTRLDEIHMIMDAGRLPEKTATVRNLLAAWKTEASAGGKVLVAAARDGSPDALRAVRSFTFEQSQDLNVLLESLPDGHLRALAAEALDYVDDVQASLGTIGTVPSPGPESPAAGSDSITVVPSGSGDSDPASAGAPESPYPSSGVGATGSAQDPAGTPTPDVTPVVTPETGGPTSTADANAPTAPASATQDPPAPSPTGTPQDETGTPSPQG